MAYSEDILNLLSMYFGKYNPDSNIGKILRTIEHTDDEFLETSEQIKNILDIDQATGLNLDNIFGINKNLKRKGLSDSEYIERLKLETTVNNSDGEWHTLEEAGNILFGNDFLGIFESGKGRIQVNMRPNNQKIPNETFEKAVAVSVGIKYSIRSDTETLSKWEYYFNIKEKL